MGITAITPLAPPPKKVVAHKPPPLGWADASFTLSIHGKVFVLPVVETANKMYRHVGKSVLKSKTGRAFEQAAAVAFVASQPFQTEVDVTIVWFRAQRSGDVDNRIKPALDILKGLAFVDDKQVRRVSIERVDSATEAPRMVVTVKRVTTGA